MSSRRILCLISLLGVCLAVGFFYPFKRITHPRGIYAPAVSGTVGPSVSRALRPNYLYSVIPGGVYSPAELRYAVQKDEAVRKHYAGFNLQKAHLVRLAANRFQYVSFRRGNVISWTRKKLLIREGEILLTDGRNYARTRCGNRLSDVPQAHNAGPQPPEKALSTPDLSTETLENSPIEFAKTPTPGELEQEYPQLSFPLPTPLPWSEDNTGSFIPNLANSNGFNGGAPFGGFAPAIAAGSAPSGSSRGTSALSGPLPTATSVAAAPASGSAPSIPVSGITAIPEPATCFLLLAAGGAFFAAERRKCKMQKCLANHAKADERQLQR